jgi:arsenical pump membrane protein
MATPGGNGAVIPVSAVLVWSIAVTAIAGILFRPKQWPEAVWACLGALLLLLFRLVSIPQALSAIAKGTDVYLFLTGMMMLAELARYEGVFDWLASLAVQRAKGSRARLFALVYIVGILVTAFLSNDATAVVLTPAVYAAVKKARATALPYLFICAFIANAASFVLPISNPANLVVYGKAIPPLLPWLRLFIVPSVVSIGATFVALRYWSRHHLEGTVEQDIDPVKLSASGRRAAWGIVITGAVLIAASAFGRDLGLPTCVAAVVVVLTTTRASPTSLRTIVGDIAWSVLPLVAGLFVLVEALNTAGALDQVGRALAYLTKIPSAIGSLLASFGVALLSNVMNNLPSGLLTGGALQTVRVPDHLRHSLLIGVDLGPNLSVTGSLATVLWLIALRRDGEQVSARQFIKVGALVMPPALLLATLVLALTTS